MNRRGFLVAAGSVLVAGCNSPSSNDEGDSPDDAPDAEPTVEWGDGEVFGDIEPGDDPVVESAAASRDVLAVGGVVQLPNPCHEVQMADWAYDGDERTLTVGLEAVDTSASTEACASVVKYEEYTFLIRNANVVDQVVLREPSGDPHRIYPDE